MSLPPAVILGFLRRSWPSGLRSRPGAWPSATSSTSTPPIPHVRRHNVRDTRRCVCAGLRAGRTGNTRSAKDGDGFDCMASGSRWPREELQLLRLRGKMALVSGRPRPRGFVFP